MCLLRSIYREKPLSAPDSIKERASMHGKTVLATLLLAVSAVAVAAQDQTSSLTPGVLYCSGVVTNEKVPQDTYLITGEQSNSKLTFNQGDYVYFNKGTKQGAKVGDEFLVIRPVIDTVKIH